jgi:hypothetical protein
MYLLLILFFVSLTGIVFLIAKKLLTLKQAEGPLAHSEESFFAEVVDWEKIKQSSVKNFKKGVHILIWIILRTYILSLNFLNKKRKALGKKIKEKLSSPHKHQEGISTEVKEPSKYLKIISEYRQKIKRLKRQIKEEEGIE